MINSRVLLCYLLLSMAIPLRAEADFYTSLQKIAVLVGIIILGQKAYERYTKLPVTTQAEQKNDSDIEVKSHVKI